MSENKNMIEFTHKQMQEMLPDYVFGRVTISEAKAFEENLDRFPDLRKEVKSVKSVFSKVERMDIDKRINQRTRNLSIKVKSQLNSKKSNPFKSPLGVRFVLPIIGIIVVGIIFYIYFLSLDYTPNNSPEYSVNTFEMVKPQEILAAMSDSSISDTDYLDYASEISINQDNINFDDLVLDEEDFNESIEEQISELILGELNEDDYMKILNDLSSSNDLYIPVDDIDENVFQLILKDIENEEFL